MVRALHATLMAGVGGGFSSPGQFRNEQTWIGGTTIERAVYVPPPPELLPESLSDWERFVNARDIMPDLIQCAIMHEQFEAIHPFKDGNGRIGRLLVPLFLMERGRLSQPLLYLSSFPSARTAIADLQRAGIVTELPGQHWPRLDVSSSILGILSDPEIHDAI